jgi:hypothetical protein
MGNLAACMKLHNVVLQSMKQGYGYCITVHFELVQYLLANTTSQYSFYHATDTSINTTSFYMAYCYWSQI